MNIFSSLTPSRRRALHSQLNGPALTLDEGLREFVEVGMPYLKLSDETRKAYRRDLTDLVAFLKQQRLTTWAKESRAGNLTPPPASPGRRAALIHGDTSPGRGQPL